MKARRVSDIMTRDFHKVKPDTTLLECAKKMVKKKVGSLLVVDKKRLVGYISDRDILWALVKKSKKDLDKIKAIAISTKKIATIKAEATIADALKKMKKLKFKKLPVIKNKEVMGIVTLRDILNFHPEIHPEISEIDKIREETEKLRRMRKAKSKESTFQGICEECGGTDSLYKTDGRLVCYNCRDNM